MMPEESLELFEQKIAALYIAAHEGDLLTALPSTVWGCNQMWKELCPSAIQNREGLWHQLEDAWLVFYDMRLSQLSPVLKDRLAEPGMERQREIVEKVAMGVVTSFLHLGFARAHEVVNRDADAYMPCKKHVETFFGTIFTALVNWPEMSNRSRTSLLTEARDMLGSVVGRAAEALDEIMCRNNDPDLPEARMFNFFMYGIGNDGVRREIKSQMREL